MNCKPGDLAVIVGGDELGPFPHAGFIVRCVRVVDGDWWDVGRKLSARHSGKVRDRVLRPLRDNPGTDETLTWAPVPKEQQTCNT